MSPSRRPSLIETVRVRNGSAPLWYLHLRRLAESCRALGIPLPRELEVPAGGADRVHRLEVGPKGSVVSERTVGTLGPVRLVIARTRHRPYQHKTTDRRAFDAAATEAQAAGADDALLLTRNGVVAEGTIWSVFWWDDGRLCTPALALGVLPGVARARLGELVGGLEERRVQRAALSGKPLLVANAVRGVVAVASLGGESVVERGETVELQRTFWP